MSTDPLPPPSQSLPGGTVRVALFAGLAEAVGARSLDLPWSGGTVRDLRARIGLASPAAAPLLARSVVALGTRYAAEDDRVRAGDDVAVIPPVSGG